MGGGVDAVYEFMGDLVLVRAIWEWIVFCDPSAVRIPTIKRTMKVEFTNSEHQTGRALRASVE